MKISIEEIDIYERVVTKIFLYYRATELFMCPKFTKKHNFKLIKLKWLVLVKNMNGTYNVGEAIRHGIEVNLYYQKYCNLLATFQMIFLEI